MYMLHAMYMYTYIACTRTCDVRVHAEQLVLLFMVIYVSGTDPAKFFNWRGNHQVLVYRRAVCLHNLLFSDDACCLGSGDKWSCGLFFNILSWGKISNTGYFIVGRASVGFIWIHPSAHGVITVYHLHVIVTSCWSLHICFSRLHKSFDNV